MQMTVVKSEMEELKKIGSKEKEVINNANKTLAEAAYADPKLKVQITEDGFEIVELPDGSRIGIKRNEAGDIISVAIDNNTDTTEGGIYYMADSMGIDTDNTNNTTEAKLSSKYYDFNKVLELAKRIFGETRPAAAENE